MTSKANTVEEYLNEISSEHLSAILKLRNSILENLPVGFREKMSYGMIGYVVPHEIYPSGYHCDIKLPLPFLSFASQKKSINVYHMGIYANKNLYDWFTSEYPKFSKKKLDMGKSCMRFKKEEDIPFELIGQLVQKMSVQDWINTYESVFKK